MSMVEKSAKAIFSVVRANRQRQHVMPWEQLPKQVSDEYVAMARASMEALKDPTPEMVRAAKSAMKAHLDGCDPAQQIKRIRGELRKPEYIVPEDVKHTLRYRAMIDAALEKKQ